MAVEVLSNLRLTWKPMKCYIVSFVCICKKYALESVIKHSISMQKLFRLMFNYVFISNHIYMLSLFSYVHLTERQALKPLYTARWESVDQLQR